MPVETAIYIDDFVITNPVGNSDPKSQGDDHIRMIKNVLQNTFPLLTGPVTKTQDELNAPVFPIGTRMLFVQTNVPIGWTKDVAHDNKALRVVNGSVGTGGGALFTDLFKSQPITGTIASHILTSAEIPAHAHGITVSGTTATESAAHTHFFSGVTDVQGAHTHAVLGSVSASGGFNGFVRVDTANSNSNNVTTTSAGSHQHNISGSTGSESALHAHSFSFSGASANTGGGAGHNHTFAGNNIDLTLAYVDVIIGVKN